MIPFELPSALAEDVQPGADLVAIDPREHALDCLTDYADILYGDIVLVPFKDNEPDWPNTDRDTIEKFAGHWSEIELGDVPRLGILTDSFARFLGKGDDTSVVTLWQNGTPYIRQIGGHPSEAAVGIVMDAIINDEPLQTLPAVVEPPCEEAAPKPRPQPANDNKPKFEPIDAETLLGMEFAPIKYVIPGFVAEGLTILGGRPKLGKSWLALDFGIAVASGGQSLGAECEEGDALYLALEDNKRRLQDRLRVVLPRIKRPNMARLSLQTEAPKIGAGLIEALDAWRKSVPDPRLIIVDTLAIVRPPKGKNQDSYAADYEALSPLQRFASEHRLAVVAVTHVRKAEAEDPLEMISGTNGLTGAADSILILNRTSDGPKLYGRGRDVEEVEKALKFDAGRWSVLGDVDEVKRSGERRQILAALLGATQVMSPAEIATATGMKVGNVNVLLTKMVAAGEVTKAGYGAYYHPDKTAQTG
ncbi:MULTISPECIES: AAA family ATPase [unclassified Mesorhizobium]|uniref:AAA family ATPase n=1 Tax=unclassified Mesorhizobium TaxID=325217 RepID=UPI001CCBED47|nr:MULTISPECIES: AAA family ATPase [unclassified Mesorhizobium]MBZ9741011.1 AAA family ATPase [Mesorhizobium sp. CO1-1-4]MBZ9804380.1 AAA family ATPase [Mesorhizobium sp. ES1-6]